MIMMTEPYLAATVTEITVRPEDPKQLNFLQHTNKMCHAHKLRKE